MTSDNLRMSQSLNSFDHSFSLKGYPDINLLISQNQTLAAELAQCQADKEFVWSLWKKLQVSNPDVTEAIALVTQREKEKSEAKDRKVLEIIQVKDDRIEELQNIVTKQAEEISNVLSKKVELSEKMARFHLDNERLNEKINTLESQLAHDKDKGKHQIETLKQAVDNHEKDKSELTHRVYRLTSDLEVAKSEKSHALSRQKILEERIKTLEKEVSDKMAKFQDLVREVEDSSVRLTRYESLTSQQRRDIEFKNQELENVRKELKELWCAHNQLTEHSGQQADLIRQLQSLQQDTQKMLKNQEDAFSSENTSLQQMFTDVNTRYETTKRTESELRQQILELKKSLMDKDDIISSLQSQQSSKKTEERDPEYNSSLLDIVQEVDFSSPNYSSQRYGRCRSLTRASDLVNKATPSISRARSLSPPAGDTEPRLEPVDGKKMTQLQKELLIKTKQVDELRRAHDNRLRRYQDLQASYKLAREEIKTLEFGRKPKRQKIKRADPRSLQKENSDEVWNELSYFKAENRSLQVDKMSLQEEVDLLRVQAAQDDATIHELRIALQTQNEDFEFRLRQLRRENQEIKESEKQIAFLKSQIQNKILLIEKLERDLNSAMTQRDDLIQEKSKMMSQLVVSQQESSQHRMDLADTRHQLQCALHQLEDMRHTADQAVKKSQVTQDVNTDILQSLACNLKSKRKDCKEQTQLYNENKEVDHNENATELDKKYNSDDSDLENNHIQTLRTKTGKVRKSQDKDSTCRSNRERKARTPVPPNRTLTSTTSCVHYLNSDGTVSRKDCATSPITFLSASSNKSTSSKLGPTKPRGGYLISFHHKCRKVLERKQLVTLQQRVAHLLSQIAVLKRAKSEAAAKEENLQETVSKLQSELSTVTGRLKSSKQSLQKLQAEFEKQHKEKEELEETVKAHNKTSASTENQEIKLLESKLKSANNEITKQAAQLKEMKADKDNLQEQTRSFQDKINHLERDISQKRNLLENQKLKLKQAEEINKTDADNVEELQTKVKLLTDNNNKMKVQVDCLRQRLSLAVNEKKKHEDKFLKVSLELDHKTKQLLEVSAHRLALESALTDLETSAKQQLHGLACQSEAAIDTAREKLLTAQSKLVQFHTAFKMLATELLIRAETARTKLQEAKMRQESLQRESDPSLQKAQNKAKDILNISQTDLEDIMSADGDSYSQESTLAAEKKMDKRWLRKLEKMLNSGGDFVHPLITLLLQKVDERGHFLLKIPR